MKALHQVAEAIFRAGLERVNSRSIIRQTVFLMGHTLQLQTETEALEFDLRNYKKIKVFAVGKASARMAQGVAELLGDRVSEGLVIIKDGHFEKLPSNYLVVESSHPVPDERSVVAGRNLYEFCKSASADELVIGLISGGASALAALPIDGITLSEKQTKTKELLASGATIQEINTVRKSLSQIKGGKLAQILSPATSLNLILSDVVGDDLKTIASGLTVPEVGPNPKNLYNILIGSNQQALTAASIEAKRQGYTPVILSSELIGEAKEVAQLFVKAARENKHKFCLLAGGETTVTIRGQGKGGRNQEMALSFLEAFSKTGLWKSQIAFLAASTDGSDGPTDAAGAFATKAVWEEAERKKLSAADYLANNDSYRYFEKANGLLKTGPTGTNVCDLQILLCD